MPTLVQIHFFSPYSIGDFYHVTMLRQDPNLFYGAVYYLQTINISKGALSAYFI